MNYQIRHTTAFIEVVHNFNNFHQVLNFINSKNFQATVKNFSIISLGAEVLNNKIDPIIIYIGASWVRDEVYKAIDLEIIDIYRDYDEFEFRNNWSFEEFEKGTNSEKLLDAIENFCYSICQDEDERKKYEAKCEGIIKALSFFIEKKLL